MLSTLVRLLYLIVYHLWLRVHALGPFECLCQGTQPSLLAPFLILASRIPLPGFHLICAIGLLFPLKTLPSLDVPALLS